MKEAGWNAVPAALSNAEKQLIVDEEMFAWKLGRQFIPENLHGEYDELARRGVHNELWPEDG